MNKPTVLQATRMKQLEKTTPEEVDGLIASMRKATEIPRLAYHLQRHAQLLGVASEEEYVGLFKAHLQREDLIIGTALRPKDRSVMWYLVAMDTRMVAQYNEAAGCFWAFMKVAGLEGYLRDAEAWWVRIERKGDGWSFEPWKL